MKLNHIYPGRTAYFVLATFALIAFLIALFGTESISFRLGGYDTTLIRSGSFESYRAFQQTARFRTWILGGCLSVTLLAAVLSTVVWALDRLVPRRVSFAIALLNWVLVLLYAIGMSVGTGINF